MYDKHEQAPKNLHEYWKGNPLHVIKNHSSLEDLSFVLCLNVLLIFFNLRQCEFGVLVPRKNR